MKKTVWIIIIILALLVSIIPWTYLSSIPQGFLEMKEVITLKNPFWNIGFYTHIFSGSIAIAIGWIQFSKKVLKTKKPWHRTVGKTYVLTALSCSFAGLFIGFWASGGVFARLGFSTGAILFFTSTLLGYSYIRSGNVIHHQNMMRYSYAMCLGAVNLRLFMTILMLIFNDYDMVYAMISWLSWIPNLIIAYWINKKQASASRINELVLLEQ